VMVILGLFAVRSLHKHGGAQGQWKRWLGLGLCAQFGGMHPRWGMVLLREVKREGAKEPYPDVWQEKGQGLCAVLGGVLGSFLG
jgi:hypothetical protein